MENIEITKIVKDIFEPIILNFGFKEIPPIQYHNSELGWGYLSGEFGIEIRIDLNYFFIFIMLFKTKDKKIPIGYKDDLGKTHKLYLQDALKKVGIDNKKEIKDLQRLGGNYKNCYEMAVILSQLLKNNWSTIQSNMNNIFSD
ncbi:MAG TPA: hypothetical protein PLM53_17640 [Spirochaetota bacterium]|nr:hypothetical protein [Spirochaetota bacterium]HQH98922.1 hypothetical protein [Spirochaetota bacterium]